MQTGSMTTLSCGATREVGAYRRENMSHGPNLVRPTSGVAENGMCRAVVTEAVTEGDHAALARNRSGLEPSHHARAHHISRY